MAISEYEHPVEDCDVPEVRRAALTEYRLFRRRCLEYMRGSAETSVMNQVHNLTWSTAVFRTLNEARRLEPHRAVNGAMWELITDGYASIMAMGIRRLVDKDRRTDSLWNVISQVERRPEMLTREKFICYDGLPYDYKTVYHNYVASLDFTSGVNANWVATRGPEAWGTSALMHKAFDKLTRDAGKRTRLDIICPSILDNLKAQLSNPAIGSVCAMADKRIAHAERPTEGSSAIPSITYNDIDEALRHIVRVADYLNSAFFYDVTFGSVVATPQFDVLEALDEPWVTTKNIPALHQHWQEICASMNKWTEPVGTDSPT